MTFSLHGVAVSRGIAIGRAHIIERDEIIVSEYTIAPDAVTGEVERLKAAIQQAESQLHRVRDQLPSTRGVDVGAFIDIHLMMLGDETLFEEAAAHIKQQRCNAEWGLKLQRDELVGAFEDMEDPYLRSRKDDIDQVVNRVQRLLLNHAPAKHEVDPHGIEGMIVIADDLTPADTILMEHNRVAAFVTDSGGPTSHTSILARSLGIPGIAGVHDVRRYVRENELLIVDGNEGVVIGEPDQRTLDYYDQKRSDFDAERETLQTLRHANTETIDGESVSLNANVELPADFAMAADVGAAGIGLYRTEFLYMNRRDLPGENEHFETYRDLVQSMNGVPVTIRTLDLGADKAFHESKPQPIGSNPALGLRAIRLSLREPSLYWPQLRAIVRASAFGPVRLMIPMLSSLDEASQVVANIRAVQNDLARRGIEFDRKMPIGAMIEVPAAAVCADAFARILDFFSIGTNDLIQYTIAIDRVNDEVNYLYDPVNPAVLRLIAMTIDAGRAANIPVSMCGEMASDIRYTRLLLGMGLREFSVHPSMLLEVRQVINRTRVSDITSDSRALLKINDGDQFKNAVNALIASQ